MKAFTQFEQLDICLLNGNRGQNYFNHFICYLTFLFRYAPESIKVDPVFSHKSDVWSFGVTLWEICSLGNNPDYPGHTETDQIQLHFLIDSGVRLPCPDKNFPDIDNMYALMLQCWNPEESKRPSFSELINVFKPKPLS